MSEKGDEAIHFNSKIAAVGFTCICGLAGLWFMNLQSQIDKSLSVSAANEITLERLKANQEHIAKSLERLESYLKDAPDIDKRLDRIEDLLKSPMNSDEDIDPKGFLSVAYSPDVGVPHPMPPPRPKPDGSGQLVCLTEVCE